MLTISDCTKLLNNERAKIVEHINEYDTTAFVVVNKRTGEVIIDSGGYNWNPIDYYILAHKFNRNDAESFAKGCNDKDIVSMNEYQYMKYCISRITTTIDVLKICNQ